jgi:urease accessory protein
VLARKHQLGPLTLQRAFHPEGAPCHLYLLHPPGGIVGGDTLDVRLDVAAGAHVLVTTPGAAKFYRSAGNLALQEQSLAVAPGGVLEWLPQPTILFPGARARLCTEVQLQGDAALFAWEVLSLGRPAIGERFVGGTLDASLHVLRDGRPLLLDRLRLDAAADLDRPTGLRGRPVTGSFVASRADETALERARATTAHCADLLIGVTLLGDLLVVRALGDAIEPVQQVFCALWEGLRPGNLGVAAVPPRIWAT